MFYEPYLVSPEKVCRPAVTNADRPVSYKSLQTAMLEIREKARPQDAAYIILKRENKHSSALSYQAGCLNSENEFSGNCCIPLRDPTCDPDFWKQNGWLLGMPITTPTGKRWPLLFREVARELGMDTRVIEVEGNNIFIIQGHGREGRGETAVAAMHAIMGANTDNGQIW